MKALAFNTVSGTMALSFDDIVFENRNKGYGSYDLRKRYRRNLILAFIFSFSLVGAAVVAPLLYYKYRTVEYIGTSVNTGVIEFIDPTKEIENPVIPPPLPVSVIAPPIFVVPEVVDEVEPNATEGMATAAEVNSNSVPTDARPIQLAQDNTISKADPIETVEEIYIKVDEPATFKGGDEVVFHNWVQEHLEYPQVAIDNEIEGRMFVEFVVGHGGVLSDIKFYRSLGPAIEAEVLRVLKMANDWKEPRQNGHAVKQRFSIPITFLLQQR